MKAALVLRGGPRFPQWDKLKRYGVTRIYWEAGDPQLDAKLLDDVRSRPCDANPAVKYEVGLMRDPSWGGNDPRDLAETINDDLVRLGSSAKQCAVMADIEYHDPGYIVQFLGEYRALRPTRPLSWTLEPNQSGWFSQELVWKINADPNLVVSPQLYYGNMAPAVESLVALNAAQAGIAETRIRCFYGLNNCLAAYDGFLYDPINLP